MMRSKFGKFGRILSSLHGTAQIPLAAGNKNEFNAATPNGKNDTCNNIETAKIWRSIN